MNKFSTDNKVWIGYFFFLLSLIVFSLLQIPSSDDYCHLIAARAAGGGLDYAKEAYFNWSGRSVVHFTIGFLFDLFSIERIYLVSLFNYFLFFLTTILLTKTLVSRRMNDKEVFLHWIFVAFFLSVGMREALSQIVSWPTGGIAYIFPFSVFFLTLAVMNRRDSGSTVELILISLCSILFEALNPALFLAIILKYFFKSEEGKNYRWLALLCFFVFSGFFYLAPGNFLRASRGTTLDFDFSLIFKLLSNYFYLLYKTLRYLWPSLILTAIFGVALGLKTNVQYTIFKKISADKFFLIIALISLAPFVLARDFYNMRASSFTVILFSLANLIYFSRKAKSFMKYEVNFKLSQVALIGYLVLVGSFILDSVRIVELREKFHERVAILKNMKGRDVEISSLEDLSDRIKSMHLDDISKDSKHWINQCVSNYYSLKSIKGIE